MPRDADKRKSKKESRTKRGPYKAYERRGSRVAVPRSTKHDKKMRSALATAPKSPGHCGEALLPAVQPSSTGFSLVAESASKHQELVHSERELPHGQHAACSSSRQQDMECTGAMNLLCRSPLQGINNLAHSEQELPHGDRAACSSGRQQDKECTHHVHYSKADDLSAADDDENETDQRSTSNDQECPDSDSGDEILLRRRTDLNISKVDLVALLLLLALKSKHRLTYAAAEDIISVSGVLATEPKISACSKYHIKQAVKFYSCALTVHHICPKCGTYVDVINEDAGQCPSLECATLIRKKDNIRRAGKIFLYLSLQEQLKYLPENEIVTETELMYPFSRKKLSSAAIEDIYDGTMYKERATHDSLTFNFFVDGLQVSSTSKQSAYPVLVTLNELPPHLRRKNIMMVSLWLGLDKPKCNEYLRPFVQECKQLSRIGVTYCCNGVEKNKKFKALMCISDSVARPALRNSKQFNGEFGCGLCYHPGVLIGKGRGYTRSYSTVEKNYPMRTHRETMEIALQADQKGIKGVSVLSELPDFDIVRCLDIDWMHAVPQGVVKTFFPLWFEKLKLIRDCSSSDQQLISQGLLEH